MPTPLTYPGVYIEEISSGVRSITGVATSITAFVGYTQRGLDNRALRIFSFADFDRAFGGLAVDSELSYAVQQFFQNGGSEAYVVRVPRHESKPATVMLLDNAVGGQPSIVVTALSNGTWSDNLVVDVDYDGVSDNNSFNLTVTDLASNATETFDDVTIDSTKNSFVEAVVNDSDNGSKMVSVAVQTSAKRPAVTGLSGNDIVLSNIKNDKTYTIKLKIDAPAKTIEFPFITASDPLPGSMATACLMFERQANIALSSSIPEARVQCVPSSSGKGLHIRASIPEAFDAQVTFNSGSTNDADAFLNLSAGNATANVSHYWPNSQRGADAFAQKSATRGSDGSALPNATELSGSSSQFTGIYALDKVDLFNILCLPDVTRAKPGHPDKSDLALTDQNVVLSNAMAYCKLRRAFLLIDAPPEVDDVASAVDWKTSQLGVHDSYGAAYFPRLKLADSLNSLQLRTFAPCGVVAGLFARTDATRGVWKAPAGTEATLSGVQGLVYKLTDVENGALNPLGLNCFRIFPVYGPVLWGARTLVGADAEGS